MHAHNDHDREPLRCSEPKPLPSDWPDREGIAFNRGCLVGGVVVWLLLFAGLVVWDMVRWIWR